MIDSNDWITSGRTQPTSRPTATPMADRPDTFIVTIPGTIDEHDNVILPAHDHPVNSFHRLVSGLPSCDILHSRQVRRAYILPDPSPLEIWQRNLKLICSTLAAAAIEHFVVPGFAEVTPTVAISAAHRYRACTILSALCTETAGQLYIPEPIGLTGESDMREPATWARRTDLSDVRLLRVNWLWTEPTRQLVFGADFGCDIEFWTESGDGHLVAPRHNRISPVVRVDGPTINAPARLFTGLAQGAHVRLPDVPTKPEFNRIGHDHIDFPIDVVYTWVDGTDADWQRRRAGALSTVYHEEADSPSRYISREELRYSLRSLYLNAPWVRDIYIVTDRQVPYWLNVDHPQIHVVDHRDLFTDTSWLPTFNSHAIESQLHHIDGLSEHFLYLNDDMFLGRPVAPQVFFEANGLSRFFPTDTFVPFEPVSAADTPPNAAAKNNRTLLEATFGRSISRMLGHTPYPLRRSVLAEIEQDFAGEHTGTAASRYRDVTNVSITSSLQHYYAFFTGRAVPGTSRHIYLELNRPDLANRLDQLLDQRDCDTFCLNDAGSTDDQLEHQTVLLRAFFESYFPVAAPYEFDQQAPRTFETGVSATELR